MEPTQYRRTLKGEDLAIAATEVVVDGTLGRLALIEDDVGNTKMQLTVSELRWLCFTAGPDILRVLEGE